MNKIFVLLGLLLCTVSFSFSGGNGNLTSPYQISTCTDLQNMTYNFSANFELINNVNCSATSSWNGGAGFIPIGNESSNFTGTLNGNSYNVSDLYMNSTLPYVGLFGKISNSTISNVGLLNVNIISNTSDPSSVAGLVSYSYQAQITNSFVVGKVLAIQSITSGSLLVGSGDYTTISNSYSIGNVSAGTYSGGISGWLGHNSSVNDSYSIGNISSMDYTGGLVGWINGSIENSFANATIFGSDYIGGIAGWYNSNNAMDRVSFNGSVYGVSFVGGLIGEDAKGAITNSYAFAEVNGTNNVGGLSGSMDSPDDYMNNSYFIGNVYADDSYIGGLVGDDYASINNSYAVGNIFAADAYYTGGLVGVVESEGSFIDNSHFIGTINSTYYMGGVVGSTTGAVTNSYAIANITNTYGYTGGVIGIAGQNSTTYVLNNYFVGTIKSISERSDDVGGVAGYLTGPLSGCYAIATLTGENISGIGGVVGEAVNSEANITNSYFVGTINSSSFDRVGGVVGNSHAIINNTYAVANLSGNISVGGVVGYTINSTANSYFRGSIYGNDYLGGLIGQIDASLGAKVLNSFSTGSVSSLNTSSFIGSLVGELDGSEINNSYWASTTTSLNSTGDSENATGTYSVGSLCYFYSITNQPMANWEFPPWQASCNDYPILSYQSAINCNSQSAPESSSNGIAKKEVALSKNFNCSNGELSVSTTYSGSGISLLSVRMFGWDSNYMSEKLSDSAGKVKFKILDSGTYSIYVSPNDNYFPYQSDKFQLKLCSMNEQYVGENSDTTSHINNSSMNNHSIPDIKPPQKDLQINQAKVDAAKSISEAIAEIEAAHARGSNTASAQKKLDEANSAFIAGEYNLALQFAAQAKELVKSAEPVLQINPSGSTPQSQADNGTYWLLIILIIVGVLGGLVIYFLFIRKNRG